mgnify:CR=1 FL=1
MENTTDTGFQFDLPKGNSSIIKVIGVGGGGNNALNTCTKEEFTVWIS